jgi:hypothetical protein
MDTLGALVFGIVKFLGEQAHDQQYLITCLDKVKLQLQMKNKLRCKLILQQL